MKRYALRALVWRNRKGQSGYNRFDDSSGNRDQARRLLVHRRHCSVKSDKDVFALFGLRNRAFQIARSYAVAFLNSHGAPKSSKIGENNRAFLRDSSDFTEATKENRQTRQICSSRLPDCFVGKSDFWRRLKPCRLPVVRYWEARECENSQPEGRCRHRNHDRK